MSPLMFRIFSFVAIALAILAAQVKARAEPVPDPVELQRLAKSPASERVSGIT